MGEQARDIKVILSEALARDRAADRAAYLDAACGDNAPLRGEVESLLQLEREVGDFLEAPALGPSVILDEPPVAEGPGTVIGRYKLLEKIGEGGMAVVYMAEQEHPIRRKVALKIIKLGMDTRQVIARFEAERQALALMDHPSIAKVHDAGATETGRPYFVMELVRGVSITEYCDQNRLSTKDRLHLFLQVCQAVQHAHTKGIIHRDIKPSNVMVTSHDGEPLPKVIDFGIAKATNHKLTEKTLFTRYAHLIGTPAYMSPEQAELSDLDIDTRSDIYSLGVLLYELLTGTTPFSEEELRKAGFVEMQRVIREQEPVKPSTRIRTATSAGTSVWSTAFRRKEPRKRGTPNQDGVRSAPYQQVRGDLDWIVMKALEKDRARRYDTAGGLAEDVRRHLEHQPILARGPSTGYRVRKLLRRHRAQAVVALAFAALIAIVAVGLSLWSRDRFHLAQAEKRRHEEILAQARQAFFRSEHARVIETIEPVLDSKHVGLAARLLHNQVLKDLHLRVDHCTRRIMANPTEANAYSERAHYYDCLRDRIKACADMAMWSALQCQRAFWNSCFGAASSLECTVSGPFGYQLVFSAERPVSQIPLLSIAFGQKGRREMKVLEIPMLMTLLIGFGLVSTIDVPPARADFTFGEPVNIKSIITVIDAAMPDVPDGFSSDGLEMYVRSYRPYGSGSIDLWVSRRTTIASDWGPLENLGPAVNSSKEDSAGCLSRDGLTLYFDSDRSGSYDLYMTTRVANTAPWGPAVSLGPKINSSASGDVCPNISPDGLELYFVSFRSGGYGGADIYVARRASTNDPWGDPTNLGPVVNSTYRETNLKLSADGLLLVFGDLSVSPFRPGGHGGGDMWMTRRASTSSPWQTPVNLGPKVNSPAYDAPLCMSPDGQILYFATLRDGKVDNWQAPILPVVEFNGDGKVDLVDLVMLINDWGKSNSVCDIGPMPWGDGKVDIEDLKVFMTYYEKENPPAQP